MNGSFRLISVSFIPILLHASSTTETLLKPRMSNLTFDNEDGKSIVIILSGLSFMDHSVTGLEPVEPVFEELNWQAKQCQITADVA